jgi:hypothetical protein
VLLIGNNKLKNFIRKNSSNTDMFHTMYYPAAPVSPLSTSSQSSNSSSSGCEDELGLKGIISGIYAPNWTSELERLFVPTPEVCTLGLFVLNSNRFHLIHLGKDVW